MKSAKQKVFTREICQPKFSKVGLLYPSTLTLGGIEWFLRKFKNECRLECPEEIHALGKMSVLGWGCPKQRLKTNARVKAVHPGSEPRSRNEGQVE